MKKYDVGSEDYLIVEESVFPYGRWCITGDHEEYSWSSVKSLIEVSRAGVSYATIETLCEKADVPVGKMLEIIGLPQTTYNKKKRGMEKLSAREGELVLSISQLLDFGLYVFNNERDKFNRWFKKENISLGSVSPLSLMDTMSGVQEVRQVLNRIEYGSFA